MMRLLKNEAGSVAVYSALAAVLGIGATALAVDYGRVAMLRTQMQNRADAGALAAAVFLDGKDGARILATDVATNGTAQLSSLLGGGAVTVASVNYYSAYEPAKIAATGDADAVYIEVTMQTQPADFFFQPVLNLMSAGNDAGSVSVNAIAVARSDPFICHAPPLMICDPSEDDPANALNLTTNIGKQIRLKEGQAGGGPWSPGNFGLLSLPDGGAGANDIKAALAAVTPDDCYTLDVTTATGSKTQKVVDGINARFDLPGGLPYPAPDVVAYERDDVLIADPNLYYGDGNWDLAGYWGDKHGGFPPADLTTDGDASRYQVYLYEQDLTFWRDGKETIYPTSGTKPSDYIEVIPGGATIPVAADPANSDDPFFDGVPVQAVASNGYERRLVRVAVLKCQADSINGLGTYPTNGNFVEMFVTEHVQDPPNAAIYGELVRDLSPINLPDFHANVRLIR